MKCIKSIALVVSFVLCGGQIAFLQNSYTICAPGNWGVCLNEGYPITECFPVSAGQDCGGTEEFFLPPRDGTIVNEY